jgi:flagella basal body P-ring formation protein FlgA
MEHRIGFLAPRAAWSVIALLWVWTTPIAGSATTATSLQDLRAIATAAEAAVAVLGPGVRATAAAVDPRLRLSACDRPLDAALPTVPKGARFSVRITCTGAMPWSVLIPVQVETEGTVVVARRSLAPGSLLTAADLATTVRRIPGLPGCCATDPTMLVGQRVRRPIAPDAPIAADSVEAAPVIRRGEIVTVIAGRPGFEVRASGIAMADAREGDPVRIRHPNTLRIIQARADSRGVARADH